MLWSFVLFAFEHPFITFGVWCSGCAAFVWLLTRFPHHG